LTSTGSANAVYIIEAFINFGLIGVILFSTFIGFIFRLYSKNHDDAFRATWPLFAFGIFVSGLLGNLFSNGFILLFLFIILIKFKQND
jgi:hypothetical protein